MKKVMLIPIGVIFAVVILAVGEVVLNIFNPLPRKRISFLRSEGNKEIEKHRWPLPMGEHSWIRTMVLPKDGLNFRYTPVYTQSKFDKGLIFLGGSFVHGDGLNDQETLPFYVGQKMKNRFVLNFGVRGGAIHNALEYFLKKREQLKGQNTWIYVLIDDHIRRTAGKWVPWGNPDGPAYVERGKFFDQQGRFEHRGINILMRQLGFVRILTPILRSFFYSEMTAEEINFSCKLLNYLSKEIHQLNPSNRFFLVIYPYEKHEAIQVANCVDANLTQILSFSNLFEEMGLKRSQMRIPGNNHPTKRANKILAEKIFQSL